AGRGGHGAGLGEQPGLADPALAREQYTGRRSGAGLGHRVPEEAQLVVPADDDRGAYQPVTTAHGPSLAALRLVVPRMWPDARPAHDRAQQAGLRQEEWPPAPAGREGSPPCAS